MLAVENLTVAYGAGPAAAVAVREAGIAIAAGEALGLIGESGCGKSTLGLAILGLLPETARIRAGTVVIDGQDIAALAPEARRRLRWRRFAYVPQSAMNALDPVRTLYAQFQATARAHGWSGDLRARAATLFAQMGLDPAWLDRFPHQFSGGMRQRAVIALALLFDPPLLIADEPTTGLDVIVQREIVDLLRRLQRERGLAMLLISHDLGVIAETARRIAVMYAGRIVETGPAADILAAPMHPYTMALRLAFAEIDAPAREAISIAGAPPDLAQAETGCAFAPRCPFAQERCRSAVPPLISHDGRQVACHRAGEAETLRAAARAPALWDSA